MKERQTVFQSQLWALEYFECIRQFSIEIRAADYE